MREGAATPLVRYEAACRAIAAARAVDEAKDIRDRAEALRAYARQSANRQLEVDASEIRFRAERRIGELMAAQRDTIGMAPGGRPKTYREETGSAADPVAPVPSTLAEAGITSTSPIAPEPTRPFPSPSSSG